MPVPSGSGSSPDFLAIVGPTAVGKTALSLEVAAALGAEIISVDSRQVYRGMDIGTAKATAEDRALVPHHGLDLIEANQTYSAGAFARDAREWVAGIRDRGNIPLLVGGTGFFLRALLEPLFEQPHLPADRLHSLRKILSGFSRSRLEAWTRVLDPDRARTAVQGGPQRMTRALEVALLTGRPLGWWHRHSPAHQRAMTGLVAVLDLPDEELDRRIEGRATRMIEAGLVQEVERLLAAGYRADDPGMTGVGYREIIHCLSGEWSLEDSAEAIRRATRQFARRQRTWFRNQLADRGVLRLDGSLPTARLVGVILDEWSRTAVGGRGTRTKGETA